ncbi:MAG: TauD/TfdA family dioxygenase [Alphaproteobacteria bacterium]|nr:TauD/TfdA family dioxygenase [Alphaproteobacteria bacterium]
MSNQVQLDIKELKPGFGAEVTNVDITSADDDTRTKLVETFHKHGALLLRDQNLTPRQLLDYLGLFGEPEGHTLQQYTLPDYPNIYLLSNKQENGRQIGAHNDGVGWHTDYSYKEFPVQNTMLYAVEVPPEGSDTIIADCCAAYNALTTDRKEQLDKLILHHSYKYFMENREYGRMKLSKELEAENPDVFHPLIRTHPADGRKALWISTGTVKEIVGMDNPEGLDLIDELVDFVTQDQFTYRHKWRVGDVLTWDNRCTLHTGTIYDDKKYDRLMYRMWIKGDKPF